jgi:hypothetical protein
MPSPSDDNDYDDKDDDIKKTDSTRSGHLDVVRTALCRLDQD